MTLPFCFVVMPFGKKPGIAGGLVDFDAVYKELIAPAIEAAGLQPLRADEEMSGEFIEMGGGETPYVLTWTRRK